MTIQINHNTVETGEALRSPHGLVPKLPVSAAFPEIDKTADIDPREDRLFRAMDDDNDLAVLAGDLESTLDQIGLSHKDQRLQKSLAAIKEVTTPVVEPEDISRKMDRSEFC
jgi:Ca2+-binding EF-hand superfamily protein